MLILPYCIKNLLEPELEMINDEIENHASLGEMFTSGKIDDPIAGYQQILFQFVEWVAKTRLKEQTTVEIQELATATEELQIALICMFPEKSGA